MANPVAGDGAPPTRFAGVAMNGEHSTDAIDWRLVIAHEPRMVKDWMIYLHAHEDDRVVDLLNTLAETLPQEQLLRLRPVWAETQLSCVLIDILLGPDMNWEDSDPELFKGRFYSLAILRILAYLLSLITDASDSRMLARHSGAHARECADALLSRMERFVEAIWDRRHMVPKIPDGETAYHAAKLNFISVMSWFIEAVVKDGEEGYRDILKNILAVLTLPLHHLQLDRKNSQEYITKLYASPIHITGKRVWLDTLNALIAINSPDSGRSLKVDMIQAWKAYGTAIGLSQHSRILNIANTSLKGPSEPNETAAYWRTPKRCFWKACGCAVGIHSGHRVRVCKGCYKVLYCHVNCQTRDWEAGHREVCRKL
ncbi:hypothetical protein EIP91_011323 [Steccherinum ochraceum]|uniref:MYND-type domain-containing protein n=1 Tax=Steccherinum ochraceum TaxID=92696 RepID=A0A4R0R7L1_9APHY|nr:hypothetical protein EIP91_011323 [Steccherinum ochraceum]